MSIMNRKIRAIGCCALFPLLVACRKSAPGPSIKAPDLSAPEKVVFAASSTRSAAEDAATARALTNIFGSSEAKKTATLEAKKVLDAQINFEDRFSEENRRAMILPAPPDFKPETLVRKIRLRLSLEKNVLQPKDFLKWRLEIVNVGAGPIDYEEHKASLLKFGGLLNSDVVHFFVTWPDGKREELIPASGNEKLRSRGITPRSDGNQDIAPPPGLSHDEKERWLRDTNARSAASGHFRVRIDPGETLHSLGDKEPSNAIYRTLYCAQDFVQIGRYQLQVEYDDRPEPLSQDYIAFSLRSGSTLEQIKKRHAERAARALGRFVSNPAPFELRP